MPQNGKVCHSAEDKTSDSNTLKLIDIPVRVYGQDGTAPCSIAAQQLLREIGEDEDESTPRTIEFPPIEITASETGSPVSSCFFLCLWVGGFFLQICSVCF